MNKNLRFSHKILLAAALIVIAAFALFTLYNDYLQRNAIRNDLDSYLHEMGDVTASNIQSWLAGRIVLVENAAQNIAINPEPSVIASLLEQKALTSSFMATYLGDSKGGFTIRPDAKMPDGFDPRVRPWYKGAQSSNGSTLTEPYIDAATGQLIISIATPSSKAGQSVGVVGGDLSLQTLVVNVALLIFGCFMDPLPGVMILVPILAPIAHSMGIDPTHFAILVIVNLTMGLVTPPVGSLLFVVSSVGKVPVAQILKEMPIFMVANVLILLMLSFLPAITTFLPRISGF